MKVHGLRIAALCLSLISGVLSLSAAGSGSVVDLFDGRTLAGWKGVEDPQDWGVFGGVQISLTDERRFQLGPGTGVLVNGAEGRTSNLVTDYAHGDAYLHIEFMVAHRSNSGVYLQGLYEIQILDSYGRETLRFSDCGGIYARCLDGEHFEGHAPRVNAAKPAGEWQAFDIVFRAPRFSPTGEKVENARFVLVVHNGKVIHENVEVTGATREALVRAEAPTGPLMLQGDHGPIAFRNIKLIPLTLD